MTQRSPSVIASLQLRLMVPGTAALPIQADLRYAASDPYAVSITFHTGSQSPSDVVQWIFARTLLSEGVLAPCGEGDVQVWPSTNGGQQVVCLSLSSPSGRALFEVAQNDLTSFLLDTFTAVPIGSEGNHVDVEGELTLLLWAEPET